MTSQNYIAPFFSFHNIWFCQPRWLKDNELKIAKEVKRSESLWPLQHYLYDSPRNPNISFVPDLGFMRWKLKDLELWPSCRADRNASAPRLVGSQTFQYSQPASLPTYIPQLHYTVSLWDVLLNITFHTVHIECNIECYIKYFKAPRPFNIHSYIPLWDVLLNITFHSAYWM